MFEINYQSYSVMDLITMVSIILNIILSLPVSLNKIQTKYRKRSLKNLLGNNDVTVHIPSRKIETRLHSIVAVEDFETYDNIRNVLVDHGFSVNLKYIPSTGSIELETKRANIVVCGPKNSYMVKETFEKLNGISFIKENDAWCFKDHLDIFHFSPMDLHPSKNEDIAFFGKVKIDETFSESVILVCGIHAIGSLGISTLLNDNLMLDKLLEKMDHDDFYSLIHTSYSEDEKKVYRTNIYKEARKVVEKNEL